MSNPTRGVHKSFGWPPAGSSLAASLWLAGVLVVGGLTNGCGDNDSAPRDYGTAQVRLEATSTTNLERDRLELRDSSGTLYTVTSLRIAVEEIELDLPANVSCGDILGRFDRRVQCDDDGALGGEDQVKIDGPFVFDLIEGTSTPDISQLRVPALDYTMVDLEVDTARAEDDTVPIDDDLIDQTVIARADFEFEGQKLELLLEFSFKAEAKTSTDNLPDGLVDDGGTLVVQVDLTNWLDSIPVSDCLLTGALKAREGVVELGEDGVDACENAENRFEANFERSLRLQIESAAEPQ